MSVDFILGDQCNQFEQADVNGMTRPRNLKIQLEALVPQFHLGFYYLRE